MPFIHGRICKFFALQVVYALARNGCRVVFRHTLVIFESRMRKEIKVHKRGIFYAYPARRYGYFSVAFGTDRQGERHSLALVVPYGKQRRAQIVGKRYVRRPAVEHERALHNAASALVRSFRRKFYIRLFVRFYRINSNFVRVGYECRTSNAARAHRENAVIRIQSASVSLLSAAGNFYKHASQRHIRLGVIAVHSRTDFFVRTPEFAFFYQLPHFGQHVLCRGVVVVARIPRP